MENYINGLLLVALTFLCILLCVSTVYVSFILFLNIREIWHDLTDRDTDTEDSH